MRFSFQIAIAACILGPTPLGRQFFSPSNFAKCRQTSITVKLYSTPISSLWSASEARKALVLDSTFVSNSLLFAASRADILLPQIESLRPQRSAPADALDKLDTLTAPWKCATLKGTLGRFVDGKVPRGPHNFLAYQGRRMRRRRGRG
jgi:hypothetical protein